MSTYVMPKAPVRSSSRSPAKWPTCVRSDMNGEVPGTVRTAISTGAKLQSSQAEHSWVTALLMELDLQGGLGNRSAVMEKPKLLENAGRLHCSSTFACCLSLTHSHRELHMQSHETPVEKMQMQYIKQYGTKGSEQF